MYKEKTFFYKVIKHDLNVYLRIGNLSEGEPDEILGLLRDDPYDVSGFRLNSVTCRAGGFLKIRFIHRDRERTDAFYIIRNGLEDGDKWCFSPGWGSGICSSITEAVDTYDG